MWYIVDRCDLTDIVVEILKSDDVQNAIVIKFQGELFTEHVETVFENIADPAGTWLKNQVEGNRVIFDFYELEYINSLTVGYLANIYNILHTHKVDIVVITSKKGLVREILEQVGFLRFAGVKTLWERTYSID